MFHVKHVIAHSETFHVKHASRTFSNPSIQNVSAIHFHNVSRKTFVIHRNNVFVCKLPLLCPIAATFHVKHCRSLLLPKIHGLLYRNTNFKAISFLVLLNLRGQSGLL